MTIATRFEKIKKYLLTERLTDHSIKQTEIGYADGSPRTGYSTRWITNVCEETTRILKFNNGISHPGKERDAEMRERLRIVDTGQFNDYQRSRYLCEMTEDQFNRWVQAMAESPYPLHEQIENLK